MQNRPDSHTLFELKPGAWLIADAHYAYYQPGLYSFFESLEPSELPPQLVLMGDIFDLLFGDAPNSIEPNRKMVDLLKRIAGSVEVVYLEGNHDFGLASIFGGAMRILRRGEQPLIARFGEKRVALHHGDVLQGAGYEIYTALIRNRWIDRALNRVDTLKKGAIIEWLEAYNRRKRPCYRIEGFEAKAKERLETFAASYDFDVWVEGHFHQDMATSHFGKRYVNLPAFACSGEIVEVLGEKGDIEFVKRKVK
ncbi:UDP-2,3-diacylglucosamine diphosphatase [Hydrogenimonas sp.]